MEHTENKNARRDTWPCAIASVLLVVVAMLLIVTRREDREAVAFASSGLVLFAAVSVAGYPRYGLRAALWPFALYIVVGTGALFLVSELELLVQTIAGYRPLPGLRDFTVTDWQDKHMWLLMAFPLTAPLLAVRDSALLLYSTAILSLILLRDLFRFVWSTASRVVSLAYDRLASLLSRVWNRITALAAQIHSRLLAIADWFVTHVLPHLQALVQRVGGYLHRMAVLVQAIILRVWQGIVALSTRFWDYLVGLLTVAQEWLANRIRFALSYLYRRIFAPVRDFLQSVIREFMRQVRYALILARRWWRRLLLTIAGWITQILAWVEDRILEPIEAAWRAALSAVTSVLQAIAVAAQEAIRRVLGVVEEAWLRVVAVASSIGRWTTVAMSALYDGIRGYVLEPIGRTWHAFCDVVRSYVLEPIHMAWRAISAAMRSVATTISRYITLVRDYVAQAIRLWILPPIRLVWAWSTRLLQALAQMVTAAVSTTWGWIVLIGVACQRWIRAVLNVAWTYLRALVAPAVQWSSRQIAQGWMWLRRAVAYSLLRGREMIHAIWDWLRSQWTRSRSSMAELLQPVGEVMATARSTLRNAVKASWQVGKDMVHDIGAWLGRLRHAHPH